MSIDAYKRQSNDSQSPARSAAVVTPHDTNDLTEQTRGILVGVTGDVKVDMLGTGTAVVLPNLAAGVVHPFQVTRIYSTDTTATEIIGVW